MAELLKIRCDSTYVDKAHPNNNYYSDNKLIVGIINKNSSGKNEFKSILKFDISDIYYSSIDSAFLFLFVEDLKSVPNLGNSISISGFTNDVSLEDINWYNASKYILTERIDSFISPLYINNYIKIDISSIFKSLPKNSTTFNLIIEHTPITHNSIIKFSKSISKFPAYITLYTESENNIEKDIDYSFNDNSNILEEIEDNNKKINSYDEILNIIDIQNNKINSIDNILLEINNKLTLLNDSINLISNNILNNPNNSQDNLNISINNLNDTLIFIKNKIIEVTNIDNPNSITNKINTLFNFVEDNSNIDFRELNNNLSQLVSHIDNLNSNLPNVEKNLLILIDVFKDSSITSLKNE